MHLLEAACVADSLALVVIAPQRRRGRATVRAAGRLWRGARLADGNGSSTTSRNHRRAGSRSRVRRVMTAASAEVLGTRTLVL